MLLAWGGFAAAYTLAGRVLRSLRMSAAARSPRRARDRASALERLPRRRPARARARRGARAARVPLPPIALLLAGARCRCSSLIAIDGRRRVATAVVGRRGRLGWCCSAGVAERRAR